MSPLPLITTHSSQVKSQRHAPTLMAGLEPGTQGAVQVWIPSRKLVVRALVSSMLLVLSMFAVAVSHVLVHGWQGVPECMLGLLYSALGVIWMLHSIHSLRRPPYLTTDAAGAGITTGAGSRAIAWSDINFLKTGLDSFDLVLRDGTTLPLRLQGFGQKERSELLNLILERANLQRYPDEVDGGRFSNRRLREHPMRLCPGPESAGRLIEPLDDAIL